MRPEPWEDDRLFHARLHRLLLAMMEDGPTSIDTVRRLMLRPDELAAIMPADIRDDTTERTIEGLITYLDGETDAASLDDAMLRWRAATEHVRRTLDWDDLTPATVKRAHLRARYLLLHAQRNEWIVSYNQEATAWRLTEKGLEAVDRFWTDGVRG